MCESPSLQLLFSWFSVASLPALYIAIIGTMLWLHNRRQRKSLQSTRRLLLQLSKRESQQSSEQPYLISNERKLP